MSFPFIWIPMLWVYDNYKYFNAYSVAIDFRLSESDVRNVYRRQTMTSKVDLGAVMVKSTIWSSFWVPMFLKVKYVLHVTTGHTTLLRR